MTLKPSLKLIIEEHEDHLDVKTANRCVLDIIPTKCSKNCTDFLKLPSRLEQLNININELLISSQILNTLRFTDKHQDNYIRAMYRLIIEYDALVMLRKNTGMAIFQKEFAGLIHQFNLEIDQLFI